MKSNGTTTSLIKYQPLFKTSCEPFSGPKLSVQQALAKWYAILNNGLDIPMTDGSMFASLQEEDLCNSLKSDVELIPALLTEEFISCVMVFDKKQYISLIQALLTNISDEVFSRLNNNTVCTGIENTLNFLQNFFYQYFDIHYRLTKFRLFQFIDNSKMKLDYLQLKICDRKLVQVLQEAISEQSVFGHFSITWHQLMYLQNSIHEIETQLASLTANIFREFLYYHNFNSACFIEYEVELLRTELQNIPRCADKVTFLQDMLVIAAQRKLKSGTSFDSNQPSVKRQLIEWINAEMKRLELIDKNATNSDFQINPENKIQTTLSVAKLAVLIRLLVVDKIIINPTIAPMLKTVSKLFTTLQKDDISFGSLETKYHAPDKATLTIMKEIMQKWVGILGKI